MPMSGAFVPTTGPRSCAAAAPIIAPTANTAIATAFSMRASFDFRLQARSRTEVDSKPRAQKQSTAVSITRCSSNSLKRATAHEARFLDRALQLPISLFLDGAVSVGSPNLDWQLFGADGGTRTRIPISPRTGCDQVPQHLAGRRDDL